MKKYFKKVTEQDFIDSRLQQSKYKDFHYFTDADRAKLLEFCADKRILQTDSLIEYVPHGDELGVVKHNFVKPFPSNPSLQIEEWHMQLVIDTPTSQNEIVHLMIYKEESDYFMVSISGDLFEREIDVLLGLPRYYLCDDILGLLKCLDLFINEIKN